MNYPVKLPLVKYHSGDPVKCSQACLASAAVLFRAYRRADGRRFVFVSELLLRLAPEFVLSAFGPAVPLPNLVGAALDFHVGRLGHHVTFQIPGRVVASSPSRAAGGSACLD